MILDNTPIAEARSLIEKSIEQLSEGQITFATLAVTRDLQEALAKLEAVQTVALPPHPVADLTAIDEHHFD